MREAFGYEVVPQTIISHATLARLRAAATGYDHHTSSRAGAAALACSPWACSRSPARRASAR